MTYYCPECGSELGCIQGCGSTGYFCDKCKKLISSKAILTEESKNKEDK
ncbi:MAG: zinc-ribbon domain-containing protein [Clostridium sp.]